MILRTDREASGGPARPAALVGLASTHACRLNGPSRDRTCFDKRCRPCRPAGGLPVGFLRGRTECGLHPSLAPPAEARSYRLDLLAEEIHLREQLLDLGADGADVGTLAQAGLATLVAELLPELRPLARLHGGDARGQSVIALLAGSLVEAGAYGLATRIAAMQSRERTQLW